MHVSPCLYTCRIALSSYSTYTRKVARFSGLYLTFFLSRFPQKHMASKRRLFQNRMIFINNSEKFATTCFSTHKSSSAAACQPQIAEENQQNQKCGRMMSVSCSGFGPWLIAAKQVVMCKFWRYNNQSRGACTLTCAERSTFPPL